MGRERASMAALADPPPFLSPQPAALAAPGAPLLSACVWDAGLALAEYVAWLEPPPATAVELGAGVGAAGLAAAARGATVALTDVPAALAGLRGTAARNWLAGREKPGGARKGRAAGGRAVVAALDWADPSSAAAVLALIGGYPDVILAADVIYPLPPPAAGEAQRGDAAPLARPPPPDATHFAAAAAALAGPATRIIVAFEARPAGVPGPRELRGALVAATDARFSIHSRLDAAGLAFAGAPHIELHEWGGVREGV